MIKKLVIAALFLAAMLPLSLSQNSCHPNCATCHVDNDQYACASCRDNAFLFMDGRCVCQGAYDIRKCTNQYDAFKGTQVQSLQSTFSNVTAIGWGGGSVQTCAADQSLLILNAANPTTSFPYPLPVMTHDEGKIALDIKVFLAKGGKMTLNIILDDNYTITKTYDESTTGLNGACESPKIGYSADDITGLAFPHTETNPFMRIKITDYDNSSYIGIGDFIFLTFNCSKGCVGLCSGPGNYQCPVCPTQGQAPLFNNCLCATADTPSTGAVSCLPYKTANCPIGCSKCSYESSSAECYDCLPGFKMSLQMNYTGNIAGTCMPNTSNTNIAAFAPPACHSSCQQCTGTSQFECTSCYMGFNLVNVGGVSQCLKGTSSATGGGSITTSDFASCHIVSTAKDMCSEMNDNYFKNLVISHFPTYSQPTHTLHLELISIQSICYTCLTAKLQVVPTSGSGNTLPLTISSWPQTGGSRDVFLATFSDSDLASFGCNKTTTTAGSEKLSCNMTLTLTTTNNKKDYSYQFVFTVYANYPGTSLVTLTSDNGLSTSNNCFESSCNKIPIITSDGLCDSSNCAGRKTDSSYTSDDYATIMQSVTYLNGYQFSLAKSRVLLITNDGLTITDVTSSTGQKQSLLNTIYYVPMMSVSGQATIVIESTVMDYNPERYASSSSRRSLQDSSDGNLAKISQGTVRKMTSNAQVGKATASIMSSLWWIILVSVIGFLIFAGIICYFVCRTKYMSKGENGVVAATEAAKVAGPNNAQKIPVPSDAVPQPMVPIPIATNIVLQPGTVLQPVGIVHTVPLSRGASREQFSRGSSNEQVTRQASKEQIKPPSARQIPIPAQQDVVVPEPILVDEPDILAPEGFGHQAMGGNMSNLDRV